MTSLTVFAVNGAQVIFLNRHNLTIYLVAAYKYSTRATAIFDVYAPAAQGFGGRIPKGLRSTRRDGRCAVDFGKTPSPGL